jgi:K(+)-stimulated pyrophosphate-energized sodium pump
MEGGRMDPIIIIAPLAGVIALLYAAALVFSVLKEDQGTEKMKEIATAIKEGAMAYLNRQYKTVMIFAAVLAVLLTIFVPTPLKIEDNWHTGVGFVFGAICSALAGYIGMNITVRANVRTANKAKEGLAPALGLAFKGGAVTGLSVVGLALLGLSLFYIWFQEPTLIVGFGFGACLISLFARVGGGIYTKAADVGADLIGKVEAGIPEDDPRNPAVIADNVGDCVGDCAGMGADLFETYVVTALAAMLLAPLVNKDFPNAVMFPLLVGAVAIFGTIIGSFFVRLGKESKEIMNALYKGVIATTIISAIGFYFITLYLMNGNMGIFACTIIGLLVMACMVVITEYFTAKRYSAVKLIAQSSQTGAGTNVISGLAIALRGTFLPVIVICVAMVISFMVAGGLNDFNYGVFGVSVAAAAMLSTTGIIVAVDSYGPITDNAGGIAEMSGLPEEVKNITDPLDAVGNTTKAVTKGYAIGSAALAALSLFAAYKWEVIHKLGASFGNLSSHTIRITSAATGFAIDQPLVLIGLFIGGALPFLFTSYLMMAVGKAAFQIVQEVRRQFKEIPGIMEGKGRPEYGRCVDIVTRAALKEMAIPGIIAVLSPLLVGFILGPMALGGMLLGVIISGLLVAIMMTTGGAAWDNAKKYIEEGHYGGKKTPTHASAVVGDTVGDAFKDTAGPAVNPLIKVMNTIAILFVALIVTACILI